MIEFAVIMLIKDKVKYFLLIGAIAFSTFLMTQQSAVFAGLMYKTTATMRNTKVPIWVVNSLVEQINLTIPMRDTDLARVRSVSGVEWALPLSSTDLLAKLYRGKFLPIKLVGVDSATLLGVPPKILEGNLEDLWKSDSVLADLVAIEHLSQDSNNKMGVGSLIDLNDHEVRIVGIVQGEDSPFSNPTLYTTYNRSLEIAPLTRLNLSYILVQPKPGIDAEELVNAIQQETGLRAYTEKMFFWSTLKWYFFNSGIPFSFIITLILGFVVGIAISGQTFYAFIYENLGNFSTLKAMGASNKLISYMLMAQAAICGLIGYGIGLGLTTLIGILALYRPEKIFFYMPWQIPIIIFINIFIICTFTVYLGIRKIQQLSPAEVFRGGKGE